MQYLILLVSYILSTNAAPQTTTPATEPVYGKAAENLILAQQFVYDILANDKGVDLIGIHGAPKGSPGGKGKGVIIAINLDRVGKPDDSDDDGVTQDHRTLMEPNLDDLTKFEISTPLHTSCGQRLNASILIGFRGLDPTKEYDRLGLFKRALAHEAAASKQLKSYDSLFDPVDKLNITMPS